MVCGAPESRGSCPPHPTAQCVPFLGIYVSDLGMLHSAIQDYPEVCVPGPGWGTRIDIWGGECPPSILSPEFTAQTPLGVGAVDPSQGPVSPLLWSPEPVLRVLVLCLCVSRALLGPDLVSPEKEWAWRWAWLGDTF